MSAGEVQAAKRAVQAAVSKLTEPVRLPIQLDDGTTTYGVVPSLWDMASEALATGNELGDAGIGRLRERSPIDLDLMEMRRTISEFTARELHRFGVKIDTDLDGDVPAQLRRLGSIAVDKEPDQWEFWIYRFSQWARLLENYLAPVNRGRRLRTACPRCGTKRVTVDTTAGPVLAHPIYVHFGLDGYIRAAECQACAAAWFRGDQLLQLAAEVGATPMPGPVLADVG